VFHTVRCLHKASVEVYLHCYQYGNREPAPELERLCKAVYYYPRRTGLASFFSDKPYNVQSRRSEALVQNLLKHEAPIICEVLHTCFLLDEPRLKNRQRIYRHSNIEHEYFFHLMKGERSLLKKLYLYTEARKLRRFERIIRQADQVAAVSTKDLAYFRENYPEVESYYLPSFHAFDAVQSKPGHSDYILYHGNLGISENYVAASWLIDEVFSKTRHKVVIAGLNPPPFLKEKIAAYPHITLRENCSEAEMNELIADAQLHGLYTQQATGLKLKLLNVAYTGRHIIANDAMLAGTNLEAACTVANTAQEFINAIDALMPKPFDEAEVEKRKTLVKAFDNAQKTMQLIERISNDK